ncbi:hypothetical protein B0H63DRAFT_467823 [Podospora didyma]|uniref:Uncharacterized protein n=1 Tax=Podospora didyma TaxID=330526 RepID=A0AAE0NRQ6_9PEZI|nr:hypothetical protein B0H63DRAFT_467823 [Podospora didyma]
MSSWKTPCNPSFGIDRPNMLRPQRFQWIIEKIGQLIIGPYLLPPPAVLVRAAPIPSDEDVIPPPDRNSAFQTLADGTQDLAALLGVFATDSVERYSFDYTQGYLSTAASSLSLLGLLGYIRAVVKLSLGLQACENAAYDTSTVRPLLGVSERDRLPSDELVKVTYMKRRIVEKERIIWEEPPTTTEKAADDPGLQRADNRETVALVSWRVAKTVRHTIDSAPLLEQFAKRGDEGFSYTAEQERYCISSVALGDRGSFLVSPFGRLLIATIAMVSISATCLTLLPFCGPASDYTWTTWYGTLGLAVSIMIPCLVWGWVYFEENLPRSHSEWAAAPHLAPRGWGSEYEPDKSKRKDWFAFASVAERHVFLNVRPVDGALLWLFRRLSFVMAISALLGYICQYIALRGTTALQSGIWLAIQSGLALIRVAIWLANPHFDDIIDTRDNRRRSNPDTVCFPGRAPMTEAELVIIWRSEVLPKMMQDEPSHLAFLKRTGFAPENAKPRQEKDYSIEFPMWVSMLIDLPLLEDAFTPVLDFWDNKLDPSILTSWMASQVAWDMPSEVFTAWLRARVGGRRVPHDIVPDGWVCRIVMADVPGSTPRHTTLYMLPLLRSYEGFAKPSRFRPLPSPTLVTSPMTEASTHQGETASVKKVEIREGSPQLDETSKKVASNAKSLAPKESEQHESHQEAHQKPKQHDKLAQESEKREPESEDVQQPEAGQPIPAAQKSQQHEPGQATTSEASKAPDEEVAYETKEVLFLSDPDTNLSDCMFTFPHGTQHVGRQHWVRGYNVRFSDEMWDFEGKDNIYLPCPTMAKAQPNHGNRFKKMVTFFNWFIRDRVPDGWQPAPSTVPQISSELNSNEDMNQVAKFLREEQAKQNPTLGDDLAAFLIHQDLDKINKKLRRE